MQKICPCLWFNQVAEEAINFYVSVFKNAKIDNIIRWGDTGPGEPGGVQAIEFTLEGMTFMAINAGDEFHFTPAISLYVDCADQAEVDALWSKLSAVPEAEQCGWLQDKYGVSWQIVPSALGELMQDPDPAKAAAVTQAMLQMKKLDVAALEAARDQA